VSLLISKIARHCTKSYLKSKLNKILLTFVVLSWAWPTSAWDVDLSRRIKNVDTKMVDELRWPSSIKPAEELFSGTPTQSMLSSVEPAQSIVILNTEEGFVPDTVRLRKDGNYKIVVANINENSKNSSFILDSFGQSMGTYFGKRKLFALQPKVNGIFTFLCPETGAQGKIIVFSDSESATPVAANQTDAKK
jgi:hypothetical protein